MTDEELIEQLAKALSQAEEWPLWEPWRTRAISILPIIREAELRGVRAGLEAGSQKCVSWHTPREIQIAIRAIDPATVL